MGQGETDPRPWDVLDQADDGGEPITHQLTERSHCHSKYAGSTLSIVKTVYNRPVDNEKLKSPKSKAYRVFVFNVMFERTHFPFLTSRCW